MNHIEHDETLPNVQPPWHGDATCTDVADVIAFTYPAVSAVVAASGLPDSNWQGMRRSTSPVL
jgi:hypothetical protein